MPRLSRWFLRAALIHLLLGFTLGAALLAHKGLGLDPRLWRVLPAHMDSLLWGWTAQLAMGVAYWILPRVSGRRPRPALAWAAFVLLNLGVLAVDLASLLAAPGWLIPVGRLVEAAAGLSFALHAWQRVRPTFA